MAHFTGLKELQNHVHRAGFDLSAKNVFSAKAGELLPVYWDIGLPNCTYDINLQYFTRTRPVQTAAYTRIREYFDFYAVPIDLLWKSFDTSVIQMGDIAPIQAKSIFESMTVGGDIPYCSLRDLYVACLFSNGGGALGSSVFVKSGFESIHGFNRGDLNYKLLHMLNYGNFIDPSSGAVGDSNRWFNMQAPLTDSTYTQKYVVNSAVNLFPLAAYQKIYQDFFRWSQWENADPTSYNFDWYAGSGNVFGSADLSSSISSNSPYWKRDNLFSLRYCNWNKDKFMGMLPNSQYGDVAVLDLSSTASSQPVYMQTGSGPINIVNRTLIEPPSTDVSLKLQKTPGSAVQANSALRVDIPAVQSNFSILALRQAEALQKYREITQSVDTNYRDQIKAHFGVNVPASDSHMAQYIGGVARNLDISEVVNNNLQGDGEAVIYGKGVGTGNGSMRYETGSRYCVLMCIYHCIPLLDYNLSGADGQLLVTNVEDLPIPEFDSIGMESVPAVELFNAKGFSSPNIKRFLGYLPRYYNWKTKIDRIHGAFTTTLKDWVAPIDNDYLYQWFSAPSGDPSVRPVQWPFFKVNPNTLDSIFAVNADSTWETDQFLVNCHIGIKCVRPLSRDGMPY